MGAWSDGIFENDVALDELGRTFNDLICRLIDSVNPEQVGAHGQLAQARVLAHMVGLVAKGCPGHNMFTRANALEWRDSAVRLFQANFRNTYKASEAAVESGSKLIEENFQQVIDHAAAADAMVEEEAASIRYAIWLRIQDEIHEKIDEYALAQKVLESYQTVGPSDNP